MLLYFEIELSYKGIVRSCGWAFCNMTGVLKRKNLGDTHTHTHTHRGKETAHSEKRGLTGNPTC
jgi:hypothetical protein